MQANGYSLPANEAPNRFSTRFGKGVGGVIKQDPPTRIRLNGNIVRRKPGKAIRNAGISTCRASVCGQIPAGDGHGS